MTKEQKSNVRLVLEVLLVSIVVIAVIMVIP
jgi:hypothetical protein